MSGQLPPTPVTTASIPSTADVDLSPPTTAGSPMRRLGAISSRRITTISGGLRRAPQENAMDRADIDQGAIGTLRLAALRGPEKPDTTTEFGRTWAEVVWLSRTTR